MCSACGRLTSLEFRTACCRRKVISDGMFIMDNADTIMCAYVGTPKVIDLFVFGHLCSIVSVSASVCTK